MPGTPFLDAATGRSSTSSRTRTKKGTRRCSKMESSSLLTSISTAKDFRSRNSQIRKPRSTFLQHLGLRQIAATINGCDVCLLCQYSQSHLQISQDIVCLITNGSYDHMFADHGPMGFVFPIHCQSQSPREVETCLLWDFHVLLRKESKVRSVSCSLLLQSSSFFHG